MDLHCFILLKSVLTEIKTREIKEEMYKNTKNQSEFSLGKSQRTRKWEYSQCPQLRWCCKVCCSCSESPRRLFSKMLCGLDIAEIVLMQVLLENTLYLLCRLGHRGFIEEVNTSSWIGKYCVEYLERELGETNEKISLHLQKGFFILIMKYRACGPSSNDLCSGFHFLSIILSAHCDTVSCWKSVLSYFGLCL